MRLEIFHLLAGAVERQLECRVLVEQKPECCDLRISIRPNGGQQGHIRFEEILVRLRKSGHLCTPTTTNTNRFSIKYNAKRSHSSNNLALPTNGCVAKKTRFSGTVSEMAGTPRFPGRGAVLVIRDYGDTLLCSRRGDG